MQFRKPPAEEDSAGIIAAMPSLAHLATERQSEAAQLQVQHSQESAALLQELRGLVSALSASVAQAAKSAQEAQSGKLLLSFFLFSPTCRLPPPKRNWRLHPYHAIVLLCTV